MNEIKFDKPFQLGGATTVRAQVRGVTFAQFVAMSKAAQSRRTGNSRYEVLIQRERMIAQCAFYADDGKETRLTHETLTSLPASVAKLLIPALDVDEGVPGEILQDGDGIETPILYKLGTPIKGAAGVAITELEFLAATYSDIETVLAGTAALFQTLDLIATVAKPVGGTLMAMPSWAADQITLADGVDISNKILPRFLD